MGGIEGIEPHRAQRRLQRALMGCISLYGGAIRYL